MSDYNQSMVSAEGQAIGSGVDFLHSFSLALNNAALAHQVQQGMKRLQPQIQMMLPPPRPPRPSGGGPAFVSDWGVLVVVTYEVWETMDATGNSPKVFKFMNIAGKAGIAKTAIDRYNNTPSLTPAPSKGWKFEYIYIWITR